MSITSRLEQRLRRSVRDNPAWVELIAILNGLVGGAQTLVAQGSTNIASPLNLYADDPVHNILDGDAAGESITVLLDGDYILELDVAIETTVTA